MRQNFIVAFTFILMLVSCSACNGNGDGARKSIDWTALDKVENLMVSNPDSAYSILKEIDPKQLNGEEELAQYSLLMTVAADMQYMDNVDFKAIQPAISYYLEKTETSEKRDKLIWLCISCITTFLLASCFIYYHWTENENSRLRMKQRLLQKEKELIELSKRADELELERQRLALENLTLEKIKLEQEKDNLALLLDQQKELPEPVQQALRQRLVMLNSLLAKEITENSAYAEPYQKWIESIHKDRSAFMDSTRLAFSASHPKMISYLEGRGLTQDEINYLCLYAIGLRGKEVGEYIRLKRHYNISSAIRKRLGLDEHDTNLGIYIRKLMAQF